MFSLSLVTLGTLGVSIAHLALYTLDEYNADGSESMGMAIRTALADNIATAIVCGFCVVFMWFVVGLTGYHCFLSFHGMTTYEHIRGAFDSLGNPFDRGAWWRNFVWIFQEPIRPSWVNLKTRAANTPPLALESKLETPQ